MLNMYPNRKPDASRMYPILHLALLSNPETMQAMENNIRKIRKELGLSQEKVAEKISTTKATIMKLETGKMNLTTNWMTKLASALHCSPVDLISSTKKMVPILGYVGAGEQVYPYDDLQLVRNINESDKQMVNCDYADAPPGEARADLVALRVKGGSMEPFLREGSLVYYGDRRDSAFDDLLNNHCVVCLKDGRLFLKILKRGFSPGRYNLLSHNATMIEDVELAWAAKVLFVKMA